MSTYANYNNKIVASSAFINNAYNRFSSLDGSDYVSNPFLPVSIFGPAMQNDSQDSMNLFNLMLQQNLFLMGLNKSFNTSEIKWKNNFNKNKFTASQEKLIKEMADRLNCNVNDIKAIMHSESGGNPHAVNPQSHATGLIQFMPSTAKGLGTSVDALKNMTIEQQLPYVEKYLQNTKKRLGIPDSQKIDAGTLYSLVFLPALANKNVLCSAGSSYYNANKGLDTNHDGQITKSDLANRLRSMA